MLVTRAARAVVDEGSPAAGADGDWLWEGVIGEFGDGAGEARLGVRVRPARMAEPAGWGGSFGRSGGGERDGLRRLPL